MLVPVKWLYDYVEVENVDIKQLNDRLIMTGSNIETIEPICEKINKIVVGKILTVERHPDAEKLVVMDINVGEEEPIQIVTGAENVFPGAYIPVALHGSRIADGTKIKKGKLRGVASNGMLCSLEELGFTSNVIPKEFSEGIYILDKEYPLGMPLKEAVEGFDDSVIEFEITPNRPDCLSMIGMAREASATFDKPLKAKEIKIENEVDNVNDYASVEIVADDLCKRYGARVVKNVKIKRSPAWLELKLMKAGMRPTNNIVDITNYVMLEYGQPIHAFDLDTLADKKIVVRRAENGEKLTTLDDVERELTNENLVIADGNKAVALAGIMGGANTEIKDDTNNILIEVACFEKSNIRKSSRDIGLRSEASSRFEKGVSTFYVEDVLDRVCQLVEELEAGEIVAGKIDVHPHPKKDIMITANFEKINKFLGIELTIKEMAEIFEKLGIKTKLNGSDIICDIPPYRLDLEKEIDLTEEVARVYGYDVIPSTLPKDNSWGEKTREQKILDKIKTISTSLGANEILTYSFVSPSQLNMINVTDATKLENQIKLKNPLGEEYSTMRTTLIPNMLEVLSRNYNRRIENVRAFEIGNLFITDSVPVTKLPREEKAVVYGMYGKEEDFFTLKGILEALINELGLTGASFVPNKENPTFHPGRCANIVLGGEVLAVMGEVHPLVSEKYDIDSKVYAAEINFEKLIAHVDTERKYKQLPKFPAMTRDIALLVKDEVTCGDIEFEINKYGRGILESVELFDVYKGKQIEEGYKSMAFALVFRSKDKTLVEEEVTAVYNKILSALEENFEAKLR